MIASDYMTALRTDDFAARPRILETAFDDGAVSPDEWALLSIYALTLNTIDSAKATLAAIEALIESGDGDDDA